MRKIRNIFLFVATALCMFMFAACNLKPSGKYIVDEITIVRADQTHHYYMADWETFDKDTQNMLLIQKETTLEFKGNDVTICMDGGIGTCKYKMEGKNILFFDEDGNVLNSEMGLGSGNFVFEGGKIVLSVDNVFDILKIEIIFKQSVSGSVSNTGGETADFDAAFAPENFANVSI